MTGRKFLTSLLIIAASSVCASAQSQRVKWDEVQIEFEGSRLFKSEQLLALTRRCVAERGGGRQAFDAEVLDYCLKRDVADFMRRSGHLAASIGGAEKVEGWPGLKVKAVVTEGEFYRVGVVRIEGAEHFDAARLRKLLPLKRGDVADGVAVSRWAFEYLRKLYADDGFIQYSADVEPVYNLSEHGAAEGVADFHVTISEGRRFVVRSLKFAGGGDVPDELLRATMRIREGEVFSEQKFKDGVRRLSGLDLFDGVDPDKDSDFKTDEETGDLEITIRLTPKAGPPRGL